VPDAVTVNVAGWPVDASVGWGCVVMVGAWLAVDWMRNSAPEPRDR